MHRYTRLLLTSITAAAILALAVTSATAGRLSVTNKNFRVAWARLELSNTAVAGTISCPVTLEGSFHSQTIRKTAEALIGYVSRATVHNPACTGGSATINQETLPWHVIYESFTGTLPNIATVNIRLIRASFIVLLAGNTCRATTTAARPARGSVIVGGGGRLEGIRADENATIPLVNGPGGIFCGLASGRFSGTSGSVNLLGTATPVTITLI